MLHRFGLRSGSGGEGKWHGGEGVIREIEFLEPIQVSILSEVLVELSDRMTLWTDCLSVAKNPPTIRDGGRRSWISWSKHMV